MANENDKINFKGMTIVPSLSLNKHINVVHNYSLQDAIDMRMSNDRTHLQNIEDIINNSIIINGISSQIQNYKIIDICACKNELVIFVKNNNILGHTNMTIFRYNEKTNVIYKAYNNYFSYYNGKLSFDYTYNVNGDLILAFCEYDTENNVQVPLKTINLNSQNYQFADINLTEDKLSIKPGIKLSNFTDVYYQSGAGYTGWHYIYIQYKINEGRYTEWYRIGFPIKLLEEVHNYLFTNDCINPKKKLVSEDITELNTAIDETNTKIDELNNGDITKLSNITLDVQDINHTLNSGTENVKHGNKYVVNTGYINKTYNFEFDLDDSFYQYRIGVVVANNTTRKQYVTEFLDANSNKAKFIFDTNQLKEESFTIEQRNNFYNVKNILNYKNELYISNYSLCDFGNINTDSIYLKSTTINKSDRIIPEKIIDKIAVGNASVYQGVFNFDNNLLWLLLSIHSKRPSINILNSLDNIQDNLIYIRKLDYGINKGTSIKHNTEYCCRLEDVYYEYKKCELSFVGSNDNPPVDYTYIVIRGKDINGNNFTLTPFPNNDFISSVSFNNYIYLENYSGIIQFRTESGNSSSNVICCYTDGKGEYKNGSMNYGMFIFAKYIYYYEDVNFAWHVKLDNIDLWNTTDTNTKMIKAPDWHPIDSFNQLYTNHPSYFQIKTYDSYIEQKQYYLTTLPPNEIFDFYIHFINKYGEISDGYRLNNNYGLYIKNNIPYVCIIDNANYYLVPANILIKYIDLQTTPIYKIDSITRLILDTYTDVDNCPTVLKNYLQNVEFKDFYFNTLANYAFDNKLIPYYNGKVLLFKTQALKLGDEYVKALEINGISLPANAIGYFISYNKIEFVTNNIGVRIDNVGYMQYYSVLNDILDYKTFNNFYDDVPLSPAMKPFTGDIVRKTVPYNFRPIYKKIFDLEIAYAGENKYGRRNKSTILTEASTLGSNVSFVNPDINTTGYITQLFNLNNNFYLNEPTLYKFSNYFYEVNNHQIIDGNLLGEYYDLLNIIYNELGVSYYYKVDDKESDTGHIALEIETLDANVKYSAIPNNPPVALVALKFVSLHAFNIETKNNPFQIGKKMFISPINTLNYFGQFIKECWEYDDYIFQKYDENKKRTTFNNTILFSNVINDETEILKWNEFLTESYKFISENRGEITNMFTLGNNIFIHCINALYILQFKDYLATAEEGLQITQSSIKDISYKEVLPTDKGYCGLQDKQASIIGNFGYIFYENDTNRLFRFDNGQLIYIDYPILQWLKQYKPYEVRFANDVERNNLIIQFRYGDKNNSDKNFTKILLYDYEIDCFVSKINNFDFANSVNTKNKLYFIDSNNLNIKIFNNIDRRQNELTIPVLNRENNEVIYKTITNKLSFIFNDSYSAIKFIEYIEWNLYKYTNTENKQISIIGEDEPIEHHRIIYSGDYLRIYNDEIDTGWIDIKQNETNGDKNEYNSKNNIDKPHYNFGKYTMNIFRNIKNRITTDYSKAPITKNYNNADDRTRLYGKWFIIEFGFNTKDYNDSNKTIEFEHLKVNVSQQTQNI